MTWAFLLVTSPIPAWFQWLFFLSTRTSHPKGVFFSGSKVSSAQSTSCHTRWRRMLGSRQPQMAGDCLGIKTSSLRIFRDYSLLFTLIHTEKPNASEGVVFLTNTQILQSLRNPRLATSVLVSKSLLRGISRASPCETYQGWVASRSSLVSPRMLWRPGWWARHCQSSRRFMWLWRTCVCTELLGPRHRYTDT